MKKSPAPVESKNNQTQIAESMPDLEFPIAPDFVSRTPWVDPQAMLRRIEENLPWRNKQPGARERRLAQKIPEEFVL